MLRTPLSEFVRGVGLRRAGRPGTLGHEDSGDGDAAPYRNVRHSAVLKPLSLKPSLPGRFRLGRFRRPRGHEHGHPRAHRAGAARKAPSSSPDPGDRQGHRRPALHVERVLIGLSATATCCSRACRPRQDAHRAHLADAISAQFMRIQFTPGPAAGRPGRHVIYNQQTASFAVARAPSSPTSSSPTRSTAPPPRCSPRCSRRCRSARSPSATRPSRCPRRSSCSPRRTPSSRRAPTRCPRRRSTASCSR